MPYLTYATGGVLRLAGLTRAEAIASALTPGTIDKAKHTQYFFSTQTIHTVAPQYPGPRLIEFKQMMDNLVIGKIIPRDYITFRIPKASGGTRILNAPNDELKIVQRQVAQAITSTLKVLPHNAAYAYTRGRCAYDAIVTHQHNGSQWFLKLDLKDFFPTITTELVIRQLGDIFPLSAPEMAEDLTYIADIASMDGVLPQGSPLSPILSNLVLLEFDYKLNKKIYQLNKQHFVYTRYADDILISSVYDFNKHDLTQIVRDIMLECNLPFQIADAKTRYGSNSGRNWNLGLMYNQDKHITIGHKKKKMLSATLNNFITDFDDETTRWDRVSTQELQGKLSYLKSVEPKYYETLIQKYRVKYLTSPEEMMRIVVRS